jgi:hypothetical protein
MSDLPLGDDPELLKLRLKVIATLWRQYGKKVSNLNPAAIDDLADRLVRDGEVELAPDGNPRFITRESWSDGLHHVRHRTGATNRPNAGWAFQDDVAAAAVDPKAERLKALKALSPSAKLDLANGVRATSLHPVVAK